MERIYRGGKKRLTAIWSTAEFRPPEDAEFANARASILCFILEIHLKSLGFLSVDR